MNPHAHKPAWAPRKINSLVSKLMVGRKTLGKPKGKRGGGPRREIVRSAMHAVSSKK